MKIRMGIDTTEVDAGLAALEAKVKKVETNTKAMARTMYAHVYSTASQTWGNIVTPLLDKAGFAFVEVINGSISMFATLITTANSAAATWASVPGGQFIAAMQVGNAGYMLVQQQIARQQGIAVTATINQAGEDFTLQ